MLEGDQWNEIVHRPSAAPSTWGESDRSSHFPHWDTEAPRGCRGGQVPTSGFFLRDKDLISGAQGIGKGDPEGKGLVITSLSLFTCA